jgi:hypothetical protein
MRRSKILSGVTLLWLALAASPAAANRVVIEYEITGGQFDRDIQALTSITGNKFALSYLVDLTGGGPNLESCATTKAIPGYVIREGGTILLSLDVGFSLNFEGYSGSFNTDGRVVAPIETLPSTCPINGVALLSGATASISMPGQQTVICKGTASYCSYTGYYKGVPVVLDLAFRVSATGGFVWNKQAGTGMINGTYDYDTVSGGNFGGTGMITFVGQEIAMSRTFVPEPSASVLAVVSLATICGLAGSRRNARVGYGAVTPNAQESCSQ